jgi:eukaryotic-like serine/threonine-protein kinase
MTMALAQALNIPLPGRSTSSVSNPGYQISHPGAPGAVSPDTGYNTVRAQEHRNPMLTPPYSLPEAGPVATPPSPGYTPYFGFVPISSEQTYIPGAQGSSPTRFHLKAGRGRILLFSMLFLILLLAGGAGIIALQATNTPPATPAPVAGHVTFFHGPTAAIGNYNQIEINISNVPPPPQGYVYYAWLVSNTLENSPAHWQLAYNNGTLHLNKQSYIGYANLLKPGTLFLVTKESVGSAPAVPYTDPQARLYYAQIPNASLTRFDIKACPTSSTANVCLG